MTSLCAVIRTICAKSDVLVGYAALVVKEQGLMDAKGGVRKSERCAKRAATRRRPCSFWRHYVGHMLLHNSTMAEKSVAPYESTLTLAILLSYPSKHRVPP